jgi:hypothetical protein
LDASVALPPLGNPLSAKAVPLERTQLAIRVIQIT